MGDILTLADRFNVSPVNTLLLVALFASLYYIAKGIHARIECTESRLTALEELKHRNATSIALIKYRLGIIEEDVKEES